MSIICRTVQLGFSYGGDRQVFSGADLVIEKGELLTVLGRNGAGKSTLFGCILGLFDGYTGYIEINGRDLKKMDEKERASVMGYVPQAHDPSFGFKVKDFVILGCASSVGLFSHPGSIEERKAQDAMRMLDIEHLADRIYSELSGGERQLVTIARALASEPEMLLFDEPVAHLDYANQVKVLRLIKKLSSEGYTVAVTTHDPNHALLLGGSAAVMHGGKLVQGSVEDMVTEKVLSDIYGDGIMIRYIEELGRTVCVYPEL